MSCKTCDELLAVYERAVRLYTNAARNLCGVVGEEFNVAFTQAEKLRQACRSANDALFTHWKDEHDAADPLLKIPPSNASGSQ